jgi:hypothetical protein
MTSASNKAFFVNHTRKFIVPAELDAVFNISKNLSETIRRFHWSLEDHIEIVQSDNVSHARGMQLIVLENYHLPTWLEDLKYFIAEGSPEWKAVTLCDYETRGPFGV